MGDGRAHIGKCQEVPDTKLGGAKAFSKWQVMNCLLTAAQVLRQVLRLALGLLEGSQGLVLETELVSDGSCVLAALRLGALSQGTSFSLLLSDALLTPAAH